MPRFILEIDLAPSAFKSFVDDPRDRFAELVPSHKEGRVTFEQRYYVVGENKVIDIISGDSDAVQALALAALVSGGITSSTCRQITTSAETVTMFQQAKESSFRPPSRS